MKKYDNFCAALTNMKEIYNYEEPYDTVVLTHGYEESATGSPKTILKTAYQAGMIKDEALWLRALQERNNVSHSYNKEIALEIVRQAKDDFYQMFCELEWEIELHWL